MTDKPEDMQTDEEAVGRLLDDVVPTAPSVKGWADAAAGRVHRRRWATGAVAAVVLAVAIPAGIQLLPDRPKEAVPQPADSAPTPAPCGPVELVGNALVLQGPDDEGPNLCWFMLESLPPQCSGLLLVGDFSWDDVEHEDVSGVRWTNDVLTFHGYLDLEAGERGVFTMSRPVEAAVTATEPTVMEFPQLCEDMLVDADPAKSGFEDQNRLHEELQDLPVVGTWVSDGSDAFNVLVQGDAGTAFTQLRTVWGGELCVGTSDAATEAERQEAVSRIWEALPRQALMGGSGGTGIDPTVEVSVLVATQEIEAAIRDAVGDIDVRIDPIFKPVEDS